MNISEVKAGTTFEMDGKLWYCVECQHVSRPRLAALIRTKLKNIETGQVLEKNFSPSEVVGDVFIERKTMQFSYEDGGLYYFMDTETFDQVPFTFEQIEHVIKYMTEEAIATVSFVKDKVISIEPPLFVDMNIIECEPAVAGDTSKAAYKPAKLETGLVVKVPLFINNGDRIRVDTRTGEYSERVK